MTAPGIRLIVGLGNPGPEYATTRHNVGQWPVDTLAARNGGRFQAEHKFHGLLCRLSLAEGVACGDTRCGPGRDRHVQRRSAVEHERIGKSQFSDSPVAKPRDGLLRHPLAGRELRLLKPLTFMNRSGQSVAAVVHYFDIPPRQILIAHDELDLPVGTLRLKSGGGHAGHNGLRDTIAALGTRDFWRLRIGIDHPQDRARVVGYVLGRTPKDDEARIRDALDAAEPHLFAAIAGEFQQAMHHLHSAHASKV